MKWVNAVLASMWIVMVMALGCASKPPCKMTKPDPRIIQHNVVTVPDDVNHETFQCVPMGIDAKSKVPVVFCTSLYDGHHIEVRILDGKNGPPDAKK